MYKAFKEEFALYVAWIASIFVQSLFINNFIEEIIYYSIIILILIRSIIFRFSWIVRIIFYSILILKIIYDSKLYINEIYKIYNLILDSIIILLSILLIELYNEKIYRFNIKNNILIPSLFIFVLQTPSALPLSVFEGALYAIFNVPLTYLILFSIPPLILNYIIYYFFGYNYNIFYLIIYFLLILLSYFILNKRLLFRSSVLPFGWLYSWLGGEYYVEDIVGVGGFSYVLKVSSGNAAFAAKVLRYTDDRGLPLASNWDVIKIFGQEMNRYLEVLSDYIVKSYKVSIPSYEYKNIKDYMRNPPYMILEYMEGGSLREYIIEKKVLSLNEFIYIFTQISKGILDIHKKNIIHLDIKPENILFKDKEGKTVKIGDLGIAKLAIGRLVAASYLSPAYAAPEVLRSQLASKASDVYSLGCVMYESLTGINPQSFVFNGYEVPPPNRYRPDIPVWLSQLIMSMLSPRPEARPAIEYVVKILEDHMPRPP